MRSIVWYLVSFSSNTLNFDHQFGTNQCIEYGTEDPDAAPVQVTVNTEVPANTALSPWRK